jgi:probable F420-dependent oxidoreductase
MSPVDTSSLGRFGVFTLSPSPELAQEVERLGYRALWVAGSPAAELSFVEPMLEATDSLVVATGVVNVWTAPAKTVAESVHRIEEAFPSRFLLGIGAGHPEQIAEFRKPYEMVVSYLDELDAHGVEARQRVIGALGPRLLKLSAERAAGAHPYLTTPEHTAQARSILGPSALLLPEHKVVLDTDPERGRATGRWMIDYYVSLTNYASNWRRLGFTDDDLTGKASDRLVDAVVAHGSPEAVVTRLNQHLEAGANHVVIQVLEDDPREPVRLLPALAELAGPLGLVPPS